ncbi:hypothetical protein [Streptomyces candidus]|uniref:Uncharacterized protein n=1 Tax=Streptomyces candidus TaxID=67283 RepID=A0A7X0LRH5_9ACTN|nr:hypothetical protein [Streptomyces candidus]MBB6438117.1 hypothetical protein [Streptomyces candidus]GHH39221.1 hypothetical protein GCM10018773_18790 [Streptomyces candidus]
MEELVFVGVRILRVCGEVLLNFGDLLALGPEDRKTKRRSHPEADETTA